jgi:hypothetical protein
MYQQEVAPAARQDLYESVQMECGRLIHAAIISKSFRQMLLTNPVRSVETGYCGEKFFFTREEKMRIKMIQAATLEEFACQLMQVVDAEAIPNLAYVQ